MNFLDQTQIWTDKEGIVHRIENLEDSHLSNILRFLNQRAEFLFITHATSVCKQLSGHDDQGWWADEIVDDLASMDAATWLQEQPLHQALRAEFQKRGLSSFCPYDGEAHDIWECPAKETDSDNWYANMTGDQINFEEIEDES